MGSIRAGLLTTLALLSGCCGLAYEVLYVRALTAILGDMFYVHAALLSTFLVGIGLGARLAHRWLRWLWVFETLIGLYALGLPIASKWFSQQLIMAPITSSALLTILATIGFISVPSLLIGFSIPLFSAYIKNCLPARLSFQNIYKFYNLGAFLSILGVELVLIRHFGISLSLTIVGAINLFNGVTLLLMRLAPAKPPVEKPRKFPRHIIVALAMASLCSAVFQMFFLKLSYLVFHPHRENFAISLSITMLGLFIGTWLVSKVRLRFETFLVLAAILIGLIYVNYLPILKLFEATVAWARSSELLILAHKFTFGCLFALGPMILFGALIPALMRTESEVASESGYLLWVSSLANATGYLVYVLIGHPFLTNGTILALIVGIMLVASLLAAGFRWSKVQGAFAMGGIVLVVLLIFHWQERNFYLAHWVNELTPEDEVTIFKSGAESATLVRAQRIFKSKAETESMLRNQQDEYVWEDVWISYNGHPSITVQRNRVVNFAEIVVGIIPALSAPRLDRALIIGLGTGVTAGATSRVFKATDVVEINKAFYKMMPFLSNVNLDIERNPSATLHLSDGRAFLVGKDQTYDTIINTVSAPTYFSASKIYTIDFYKRVKKSLKPDGVFSTWISADDMSREGTLTILSALQHSFDYCELRLLRGYYYLLTCSNQPIRSKRRFSELTHDGNDLARLLQLGLPGLDLDEFFEDIRLSENIFDHFTPEVPQENTDDHPVLEFMVVRDYQLGTMGSDPFIEKQALFNIDLVRRDELAEPARLARRMAVFYRLGSNWFRNFLSILMKDASVAFEFFLLSAEYNAAQDKHEDAIKQLTTALKIRPNSPEAHNSLGTVLASQGNLDEAISHFRKALQLKPDFAQAHNNLGLALTSKDEFNDAIHHFRQALKIEPHFIEAYCNLGNALASQGKLNEAIQTLREALAYNQQPDLKHNVADIHFSLATALKKSNKIQQASHEFTSAVEEYRRQMAQDPTSVKTVSRLGNALMETNNFTEATKYLQQAVNMKPYDIENHSALTQALVAQERYDDATVALKKAMSFMSGADQKEAVVELQKQLQIIEFKKSKHKKK